MGTVFRFKAYELRLQDGVPGRSWSGTFSTRKQSNGEEQVATQPPQTQISSDPDSPTFDWGQYQDFHFVNTDTCSFYSKKDRTPLRAHVTNDLNKKERLKMKLRVKCQRRLISWKTRSTNSLQAFHLRPWSQPTLAAAPTQAASDSIII